MVASDLTHDFGCKKRSFVITGESYQMRILMIGGVGKAESGVGGVLGNLASELRKLGHKVTPMCMGEILPNPKWPNRFRTVEFAAKIAGYVASLESEFDVVNVHAPFGFVYGAKRKLGKKGAKLPYVMTMHGLEERRIYAMGREAKKGRSDYFRFKNRVWQKIYHMPTYQWSFKTADQCIVLNRESKTYLEYYYLLSPARVSFIPNGVGPEFFQERSFVGGTAFKLLFVGTWIDHKGIYYLSEAFSKVLAQIPAARLTIVGSMVPESQVRLSFPESAQKAIIVRPFATRAEMPGVYADHDVFVLPSLVEGMPLVLLEAMASGMPVVTTESSGMTDLVDDSENGLLTIPGDSDSLAQAILKLCNDAALRQRLGSEAAEKMKRYTWRRAAERHEHVFYRAIGIAPPEDKRDEPRLDQA
jgi:glycosyltransferase involved in cell wall biosynthesis